MKRRRREERRKVRRRREGSPTSGPVRCARKDDFGSGLNTLDTEGPEQKHKSHAQKGTYIYSPRTNKEILGDNTGD